MSITSATMTASGPASTPALTSQPAPDQMRAVTSNTYGDSSVLRVSVVDRPSIGADEVLIRVRAAGLDRGTQHLLTGRPWLLRLAGYGLLRPSNPVVGLDVSGVVAAVGADVTRFAVGDAVFGIARGSFAEFAAASETKLTLKPSNLSFEEAAVSTVSGITALQALTDVGRLEAGQRVLIIGASGGVGTFAVQLAKALGGVVDGVAGAANLDLVTSLGASYVYDHRSTDLADITHRYDLVLDIGGRNPVRKLRRLLTPAGTLVLVGGEDGNRVTGGLGRQLRGAVLSPFVRQRLAMFVSTEHHSFIERLAQHMGGEAVRPVIGAQFPLDDAIDAFRRMESGQSSGKTVIAIPS